MSVVPYDNLFDTKVEWGAAALYNKRLLGENADVSMQTCREDARLVLLTAMQFGPLEQGNKIKEGI